MFQIDTEKIQQLRPHILEARKIVLIGHTSPDGDAVSSILALYMALQKITNAQIFPVLPDEIPNYVQWFEHIDKLIIDSGSEELISHSDIVFCLDFNEARRVNHLSVALLKTSAIKVLIDHHPQLENFADFSFSYPSASSTAEIVFYFIKNLDAQLIDKSIATYLFSGILTDTGVFVHDSADSQTMLVASELLSYGLDKGQIIKNLFNNYSENRMRLMGYLLYKSMKVYYEHEAAVIILSNRIMKKFSFTLGDHENIANLPLSIKGVEISIFVMQKEHGIKVSFRSKGKYNVNLIARDFFQGGGHKNAAGGSFIGSLHRLKKYLKTQVLPNLKNYQV